MWPLRPKMKSMLHETPAPHFRLLRGEFGGACLWKLNRVITVFTIENVCLNCFVVIQLREKYLSDSFYS